MSAKSNRCSHCVRDGKKCDGPSLASNLLRNLDAQRQVDRDIASAEGELQALFSRLSSLRRQREELRERGAMLFSSSTREIEESDGIRSQEEALALETQQVVGELQLEGAFGVVDWDAFNLVPEPVGASSSKTPSS